MATHEKNEECVDQFTKIFGFQRLRQASGNLRVLEMKSRRSISVNDVHSPKGA